MIKALVTWLKLHGLHKEADQVSELEPYAEPWHEEAVQEYGGEPISEEEYLDQFTDPGTEPSQNSVDFDVLSEVGFQPLMAGGKDSELGGGGAGVVYRGVYQGKNAAAKVIYGDDQESEVWQRILEAKPNLPPELQRFIPEIYSLESGEIEDSFGVMVPYHVIIMEELYPINKHVSEILYLYGDLHKKNMSRLFKDEDFLFELAKRIYNKIEERTNLISEYHIQVEDIFKVLLSLDLQQYVEKTNPNHAANRIGEKMESLYEIDDRADIGELRVAIAFALRSTIDPMSAGFPTAYQFIKDSPIWEFSPETQKYFEMLDQLAKNFNIKANDLHQANVMMDRDGNLKIIDVGYYVI